VHDRELDGRIEVDDAWFGKELSEGKTGRSAENRIPFMAAVLANEL
jgi:hypothetical protein